MLDRTVSESKVRSDLQGVRSRREEIKSQISTLEQENRILEDREESIKRTIQVFFPDDGEPDLPASGTGSASGDQAPESSQEPPDLGAGTTGDLLETIFKELGNRWMPISDLMEELAKRGRPVKYNTVDSALKTRAKKLDTKREGKRKLYRMKSAI
jgi:hypothetical protein